jgi:hypothetical protein
VGTVSGTRAWHLLKEQIDDIVRWTDAGMPD